MKPPKLKLEFGGTLCSGLGEGARFTQLPWAVREFRDKLGFEPYPGTLNLLLNSLKVTILAAARSGDGTAVAKEWTKEVDFSWASQKFKGKLKEANDLGKAIPPKPEAPADPDDQELVPGSYVAVGNDGQHWNNSIQDPPTIPEGAAYASARSGAKVALPFHPTVTRPIDLWKPPR